MKVTFITWYPSCRRSDALAKALGGVSHLIHFLEFKQPVYAPLKYMLQTFSTFRHLWGDKPDLIVVASPPVFAVLAVWLYSRLLSIPYVIDAHTGVFDDPRWRWLLSLSRFLSRQAVATVVTNAFLKQQVENWGARAVVIGDVPIEFPAVRPANLGSGFDVVVINTFSQDEPLDEILLAARKLPEIRFHITGNSRHARTKWCEPLPSNAHFTGWLSDEEYAALLLAADVVMSLTTHDHTMQRGGYEAMAIEKPLITSNWALLQETFYCGTIHVANKADEIASAIMYVLAERSKLVAGMRRLRRERLNAFADNMQAFRKILAESVSKKL
jgi:glycosyltransferase involved in cell wall biosynthesis